MTQLISQLEIIKQIQPGQSYALIHEGYSSCESNLWNCSMRSSLSDSVRRHRKGAVIISFAHLPDGRLGVACFAKEDKP